MKKVHINDIEMDVLSFYTDAAVIPVSAFMSIETLTDPETKNLAYKALMLSYLTNQTVITDDPNVNMFILSNRPFQMGTLQRFEAVRDNGAKGGRPIEVDPYEVKELRKNGYPINLIAKKLNCSVRTVQRKLETGYEPKTPLLKDIQRDLRNSTKKDKPTSTTKNVIKHSATDEFPLNFNLNVTIHNKKNED